MNRRTNLLSLVLVLAVALFATSCGSKLKPLSQNNFNVTPSPLETVGMQVPVAISGTFPEGWFRKNAIVTITPILKFDGREVAGTPHSFQGENVSGNRTAISNRRGGNFTMNSTFNFIPEMQSSELYLRFETRVKNRQATLPDLKVADGVLATSALASVRNTTPSVAPDGFQRIIQAQQESQILFLVNETNLRSSQINSSNLTEWKRRVEQAFNDERQNVNVEISAYASPEGPTAVNERLAAGRERVTAQHLQDELARRNVNTQINAHYTAEDWEGFRQMVAASNIQDKDLILRVLEMYPDSETREREIKNISFVFSELAETILPQLRRSRIIANIELIGKSDDEILDFWHNRPRELSVEELLYASTLTGNPSEIEQIYQFATAHFPQDYRGWNNMGTLFYRTGEFDLARQAFDRAAQVSPSAIEVNVNKALLSMLNNDLASANELLGRSAGANSLDEAMGLYNLMQGNYNQSVNSFGNVNTNNAALAQLLVRDYNKAKNTLQAVANPDATTAYLLAIIAARTNSFNDVVSNLRTAISREPAMARRALNDLEFAQYRTNQEFRAILQ
jgi:tetratricopeptide (TPR) repeat protein